MQNLSLQVLWLDDSLGLAINQKTSNCNIPITPYYFWPVSEAWEQIKFELDSKPWISKEERVAVLNSVVKTMNKWQKSRSSLINNDTNNKIVELEDTKVFALS